MQLISYETPAEYLNATQAFLELRELENNLILGLCNGFPDLDKPYTGCHFINVIVDNEIRFSSICTATKAILSGSASTEYLQPIVQYYTEKFPSLTGVLGEKHNTDVYLSFTNKNANRERVYVAHELIRLADIKLSPGKLQLARQSDLSLIVDWTYQFQEEAQAYPKKNLAGIKMSTQNMINKENLFVWMYDNHEPMSIAAIVRKTTHYGIIGLVYTPPTKRGRGYASSLVHQLSDHILHNGLIKCGLFTDQSNPTSNKIYHHIGYRALAEFSDIEFL